MTTPSAAVDDVLDDLLAGRAAVPVVVAPMAGGPSRPELVAAAGAAGALGFLAAGYRSADEMAREVAATRTLSGSAFGVNVFVPAAAAVGPGVLAAYLDELEGEAERYGVDVGDPMADDDEYEGKIEVLLGSPVAVVSFTFGAPSAAVVAALRAVGTRVVVTVTGGADASVAAGVEPDALCVQGGEAGGHHGTFANRDDTPAVPALVDALAEVRAVTDLPLIAAGGITSGRQLGDVLAAGAVAAQVGTLFLRSPEAGTRPTHRRALADPRFTETAVTMAFTGRRARGLQNRFMIEHPAAPAAYPQIHHATVPIRAAAAARGDAEGVNLWAGTGWRDATDDPTAIIIGRLVAELEQPR